VLKYRDGAVDSGRRKPRGATQLQLFSYVGNGVMRDPGDARLCGCFTRSPFTIGYDFKDAGKQATYFARWVSGRGEFSAFSPPSACSSPAGSPRPPPEPLVSPASSCRPTANRRPPSPVTRLHFRAPPLPPRAARTTAWARRGPQRPGVPRSNFPNRQFRDARAGGAIPRTGRREFERGREARPL
jgi:hypothetical protein